MEINFFRALAERLNRRAQNPGFDGQDFDAESVYMMALQTIAQEIESLTYEMDRKTAQEQEKPPTKAGG